MKIVFIPLDSIDEGDRLRPVDDVEARHIAASVKTDGVHTPIQVRPGREAGRFLLVAGAHRLRAAKLAGLPTIPAMVSAMSDDEARLAEINENVYRHELSDLDRAVVLAEKKRIHDRLHPHTAKGRYQRDRIEADQVAKLFPYAETFTADEAERLGITARYVRRLLKRAEIEPDVRSRLAGTKLSRNGSELDKLVKLSPKDQRSVIELLLGGEADAPKTVDAAAKLVGGKREQVVQPDDELQLQDLEKRWRAAGKRAREAFAAELRKDPVTMAMFQEVLARRSSLPEARP